MRSSQGFTLAEVLIALAVLTIGVLVAADMQVSALATSSRAAISRQLTRLASAELELQRQLATPRSQTVCSSGSAAGYACKATLTPCSLAGTAFTWNATSASPAAYSVRVVTNGPRESSFTLATLIGAPGTP